MSRELRRVPATWEHPKDERGRPIPLHGDSFTKKAADWDAEKKKWDDGLVRDWSAPEGVIAWKKPTTVCDSFEEWHGERPSEENHMPDWPEAERTHYQMYETTSEGTPISPVMPTPEALARWLAATGASAFAGMPASYEDWLATCQTGWAPSAVMNPATGQMVSGVAVVGTHEREKQ